MTEPAYSAEDLRIAKSILKQYCTESDDHDFPQEECRKCDGMAYDFAVAIAKVRRECDQAAEKLAEALRPFIEHSGEPEWWEQWGGEVYSAAKAALAAHERSARHD